MPLERRRGRLRRSFLRLHQIIGLFAGALFVLIGLSGGVLAFREDIDEWLNDSIMRVEPPAQASPKSLNEILAAAVAAAPPDAKLERLTAPRHARAAAAVTYMVDAEDLESDFYETFVDPYTAQVKGRRLLLHGDKTFSQPFIQILLAFHSTLLLGANNAYLVGSVGVLLLLSVLVGLYLWWPRNGDWRLGLKVKWGASRERIVYDLHRCFGIYGAAILLVMLLTGVAMIFKPATRGVTALFSPVRADPDFGRSKPITNGAPIGVDAAVAAADRIFPDGRLHWVLLPSTPTGVYVVGKQSRNEPSRSKTFRNVGVDQYGGEVLGVQDRSGFTAGERFLEWLFPLHSGEAFGEIGRPLTLLIGLLPLVLYVTGFLRWRQRRRGRAPPSF
ncbi:peptidase M4 [Methylocystis bryophila]|uniref:Peptidase M4 n=1 Tax=Methylocystis bryophila TaxID=655015 RepID=A0A1W6N1K8_9HYPH|nr:peptidase M4 [Methylocystis bryophila]